MKELAKRLLVVSLLFSCNPVKQVLNNPKRFEKVKEAVIRSGACVTEDSVTVVTRDSVAYKDSIIEKIVTVPCPDVNANFPDGGSIKISSGVLKVTQPVRKEYHQVDTKTQTTKRDISLENILKSDIAKRDSIISYYAKFIEKQNQKLKDQDKENRRLKWKLILLAIAALLIIFRKQVFKLATLI